MTEYQKGFLEALQAVCIMGEAKWRHHFENASNPELTSEGQEAATNCCIVIGNLVSDVKLLAAQVHRGQLDPQLIGKANGEPFWWATEDGKGKN